MTKMTLTDREFVQRERDRNAANEAVRLRNIKVKGETIEDEWRRYDHAMVLVKAFYARWGHCQKLHDTYKARK